MKIFTFFAGAAGKAFMNVNFIDGDDTASLSFRIDHGKSFGDLKIQTIDKMIRKGLDLYHGDFVICQEGSRDLLDEGWFIKSMPNISKVDVKRSMCRIRVNLFNEQREVVAEHTIRIGYKCDLETLRKELRKRTAWGYTGQRIYIFIDSCGDRLLDPELDHDSKLVEQGLMPGMTAYWIQGAMAVAGAKGEMDDSDEE